MRNLAFCMCENKVADQLRSVFAIWIVQSLYFLNTKFKLLAIMSGCTAWFVSDLVGTSKTGFLTMRLI